MIWSRLSQLCLVILSKWNVCPATGVGYCGGALQRNPLCAPAGGEYWRDVLHRQRGLVRHLFPDSQAVDSDIRWSQPSRVADHVWRHHVSQVSSCSTHAVVEPHVSEGKKGVLQALVRAQGSTNSKAWFGTESTSKVFWYLWRKRKSGTLYWN